MIHTVEEFRKHDYQQFTYVCFKMFHKIFRHIYTKELDKFAETLLEKININESNGSTSKVVENLIYEMVYIEKKYRK